MAQTRWALKPQKASVMGCSVVMRLWVASSAKVELEGGAEEFGDDAVDVAAIGRRAAVGVRPGLGMSAIRK